VSWGRKWPHEATDSYRIKATPKQTARWYEAKNKSVHREIEHWIASAADCLDWYQSRERELMQEMQAKLDAEIRARLEAER
jgi:hypothetical protein